MSDPQGQLSKLTVADSPLNQSSTSGEFADILPDKFAAWLESVTASEANKSNTRPRELTIARAPACRECKIEGAFEGTFEGTLRVDGYLTGSLHSLTGTLIIGESGGVESNIVVANAIIDGFLHGDICATEGVELGSHARVFGNIESPALSIQPGAIFEGQCRFLPSLSATDSDGQQDPRTSRGDASLAGPRRAASGPGSEEAETVEQPFVAIAAAG